MHSSWFSAIDMAIVGIPVLVIGTWQLDWTIGERKRPSDRLSCTATTSSPNSRVASAERA